MRWTIEHVNDRRTRVLEEGVIVGDHASRSAAWTRLLELIDARGAVPGDTVQYRGWTFTLRAANLLISDRDRWSVETPDGIHVSHVEHIGAAKRTADRMERARQKREREYMKGSAYGSITHDHHPIWCDPD